MTEKENNNSNKNMAEGERIAKVIARAGICSRRDAEKLIGEGRVSLNGEILDTPAVKVTSKDLIELDGTPLQKAESTRLFMYHKPLGLLSTSRDERGRETIFDDLPLDLPRLMSVGRLDLNTEGLLLLTNDGELSRYLELPATGWERTYRVRVWGPVDPEDLKLLKEGITYEGVEYGSIDARLEKSGISNSWIVMTLTEGKNREIRNVMRALGLQVNRLIRMSYGPFDLGEMEKSEVIEVPPKKIKQMISGFYQR
jgi:23S rRNA pseudouridine2605 synthase